MGFRCLRLLILLYLMIAHAVCFGDSLVVASEMSIAGILAGRVAIADTYGTVLVVVVFVRCLVPFG